MESNEMRIVIILTAILLTNCSKKNDGKPIEDVKVQKNNSIDILEDGKRFFTYVYNEQNLPTESILYNTQTNNLESKSKFNYQNGKFSYVSVNNLKDDDYTQSVLNYLYQAKYLSSKGIKIEHPEIVGSEIGDLSNLLSIGDGYKDFKKDSIVNGNEKTIIYKSFNKKIRFYPSYITLFIPEDEIIKEYNLVIKDSLPIKETFLLENNQSLKRKYFYENKRIKKITYISSDPTNKLRKEFIYKN
ncbi:hypothetical protein ODZ84_01850 [Chryseobacterium fluminis]|uniref:hypothetical protein n=1 Tax=Chryseobacterium fluminis TaxID=2983606 RepID=UPI0022582594|nr:hypothetical protein [Chryseobacterium sp. MMS21-Ot14]UZT98338.1 hypothetical protein ODZ84_01850 [Chryseobacterium sp. MMS21-Ot14]